jgi:adenylate kinase
MIIAGAPASGKGTQCEYIKQTYGLVHLSSGDMLRAAVAAGTPVGRKAQAMMAAGELVPDDVVIAAVAERLAQPDVQEHGFLLDGFPRTPGQALALQQIGLDVHLFVMLDVPDAHIVERVTGRRVDPVTQLTYHIKFKPPPSEEIAARVIQRADDTEEAIVVRLRMFHDNIASVASHYERVMVTVNGTRKPDDVWGDIDVQIKTTKEAIQVAKAARVAPVRGD